MIEALEKGETIDFEGGGDNTYRVHDVASALKRFLRELPQPLFTDAHYNVYIQVAGKLYFYLDVSFCFLIPAFLFLEWFERSENLSMTELCALINRQLSVVRLLMLILPDQVIEFLCRLLRCLQLVAKRHRDNKMDEFNLATIFTPIFFFPRSIDDDQLSKQANPLINLLTIIIQRADEIFKVSGEVIPILL